MNKFFTTLIIICVSYSNAISQWIQTNGPFGGYVNAITTKGDSIYIGTEEGGLFLSTDSANSWNEVLNGSKSFSTVRSVATNQDHIYAGAFYGLARSYDNGVTWDPDTTGVYIGTIGSIATHDSIVVASAYDAMSISTDYGHTFQYINPPTQSDYNVYFFGNKFFAGSFDGLFTSDDLGHSWMHSDSGIALSTSFDSFVFTHGKLFVSGEFTAYSSLDSGATWTEVTGLPSFSGFDIPYFKLAVNDSSIFAGTYQDGIFRSDDGGVHWSAASTGLLSNEVLSLSSLNGNVFAGTRLGVFESSNNGILWSEKNNNLISTSITSLIKDSINIFAGSRYQGVFLSSDRGQHWERRNNLLNNLNTSCLARSGNFLVVGTDKGIYKSANSGLTWLAAGASVSYPQCLYSTNTNLFAGASSNLYRSDLNLFNWTESDSGIAPFTTIHTIIQSGANLLAGALYSGGLYLSTDNGTSWTENPSLPSSFISSFAASGNMLLATTYDHGLFLSGDNGNTWNSADSTIFPNCSVGSGTTFYAGGYNGISASFDNGTTWSSVSDTNLITESLMTDSSSIFAGTEHSGVWIRNISQINNISTLASLSNLLVYPNPATSRLNILTDSKTKFDEIKIMDLTGKILTSFQNQKNVSSIDLNLRPGVYFIQFILQGELITKRFIVTDK